jgi:SAM-dependent methyltransferase
VEPGALAATLAAGNMMKMTQIPIRKRLVRKWWFKCAIQLVLAHIPLGERINNSLRGNALYQRLNENALRQGLLHVKMLRRVGVSLDGAVVLEIGSGWKPIVPFVFRAAGCCKVLLCDLYPHLDKELLATTLHQMREYIPLIAAELEIEYATVEQRIPSASGQNFSDLLGEAGFEYYAPFDVRTTQWPSASVDIVTSRATLEHIPPQDLVLILQEMKRLVKPSGAMVHTIDHSDHWQHFDHSISRINFLKFPDWWWRIIGENKLVYQNRLRSCEYVNMILDAGFQIADLDARPDSQVLEDFRHTCLIERYRHMTPEQVAALATCLVARPSREREAVT